MELWVRKNGKSSCHKMKNNYIIYVIIILFFFIHSNGKWYFYITRTILKKKKEKSQRMISLSLNTFLVIVTRFIRMQWLGGSCSTHNGKSPVSYFTGVRKEQTHHYEDVHFPVLYFSQSSSFYLYKSVGPLMENRNFNLKRERKENKTSKGRRNGKEKGPKTKGTWQKKENMTEEKTKKTFLEETSRWECWLYLRAFKTTRRFFSVKGQFPSNEQINLICVLLLFKILSFISHTRVTLFQRYSIVHILLLAPRLVLSGFC